MSKGEGGEGREARLSPGMMWWELGTWAGRESEGQGEQGSQQGGEEGRGRDTEAEHGHSFCGQPVSMFRWGILCLASFGSWLGSGLS